MPENAIHLFPEDYIPPRWIKLKSAPAYSGIGQKRLIQLATEGHIRGYQSSDRGDWLFDRISIDEYHLNRIERDKEKIRKILRI